MGGGRSRLLIYKFLEDYSQTKILLRSVCCFSLCNTQVFRFRTPHLELHELSSNKRYLLKWHTDKSISLQTTKNIPTF